MTWYFSDAKSWPQRVLTYYQLHPPSVTKLISRLQNGGIYDYIDITWAFVFLKSPATRLVFNSLSRLTTKKHQISASLAVCEGNPSVIGVLPARVGSNAESFSMTRRRHDSDFNVLRSMFSSLDHGIFRSASYRSLAQDDLALPLG